MEYPVFNIKICDLCSVCERLCANGAIHKEVFSRGDKKFLSLSFDYSRCVFCKTCFFVCPHFDGQDASGISFSPSSKSEHKTLEDEISTKTFAKKTELTRKLILSIARAAKGKAFASQNVARAFEQVIFSSIEDNSEF